MPKCCRCNSCLCRESPTKRTEQTNRSFHLNCCSCGASEGPWSLVNREERFQKMLSNMIQANNRQRAYSRDSLPYGLLAGEGSASSSGSSLSSSMNRSRTSTGDSSLSTDTNASAGSGTGIPPTPPPPGQDLSSSSTTITNTNRRRSHRPRGCRGGRKNRKKNSLSSNTDNSCSANQQPVPTEIVGSIPLSPRDSNTQNGNNNTFNNGAHPSKANLNIHQPHDRHSEVVSVKQMSDGADVSNRNTPNVSDENIHQATMTTNTTTMVVEGTHSSVVSSHLPHPKPILAVNINNMSTGQQDQHQQMYTRNPYHPNPTMRFQHHPSNTFIAHPMSYDRSINENNAYYHNDSDFHQIAGNNNNNNIRHQEQQLPQSTTMDRHFDPSRSVDAIATKSIGQLQMLAASKNMISMGEILPPLPSTKRADSPVHVGPNPYALINADQSRENTSPIMTVSTTTTIMNARSSNESSQFNVQTMNLHHIANAHSENISNNNNCLSSSMTQDGYRNDRLEKQRQMLADGGSLFVVSPRSFLTGVKVRPSTATTTTAW